MNSKLARGVGAGLAAIALAFAGGGGTHAAPEASADVRPNAVSGGVLVLTLGSDGGRATLSFDDVLPGESARQLIWVAGNDESSSVAANLDLSFGNVRDIAAPCDTSLGKAEGEIDSGVAGCRVSDGVATGTPGQGNLSRLLTFDVAYALAGRRCGALPGANSLLPAQGVGNLRALDGESFRLADAGGGADLVVHPGEGVCVAITASWPENGPANASGSPSRPIDNAAQGDSLSVQVRFDLTQVHA